MITRRCAAVSLLACLVGSLASGAGAQSIAPSLGEVVTDLPRSPVLTIDQDRLFVESRLGQTLAAEIDAATRELAAENRRIEAELIEEERALTDLRATLPAAEFAARADDFDARVEAIRRSQDAKSRDLARSRDEARQRFFDAAVPVLSTLMQDAGAVAILNAQAIFLSFGGIDVTDAAIDRLDRRFEDALPTAPTQPPPAPD